MTNKDFIQKLIEYRFYDSLNEWVSLFLEKQIDNSNKDKLITLFNMYFVFAADGNCGMSLDKNILKAKWEKKCDELHTSFKEENDGKTNPDFENLKQHGISAMDAVDTIKNGELSEIIGTKKLFNVEADYLFFSKYYNAIIGLRESVSRIFMRDLQLPPNDFDYNSVIKEKNDKGEDIRLSSGQQDIVEKGKTKNLIVTGGPGTGKTTSIVFLLVGLLMKKDAQIYLTAPSGKAASRMKESINKNFSLFTDEAKEKYKEVFNRILSAQEYTIHRLLGYDFQTNDFLYGAKHQFSSNSIFVIDEASMIDITLFNSLLSAIPEGARVFILGDKNQLPSVESGAVLAEMLANDDLRENQVELKESQRFKENTEIYKLADEINCNRDLTIPEEWSPVSSFKVEEINKEICPIYYYQDLSDSKEEREKLPKMLECWGNKFYKDFKESCKDLAKEVTETDLKTINDKIDEAKILCANNEGTRGVSTFNKFIQRKFFNEAFNPSSISSYTPGNILMQKENNNSMDLYNGDTGILVSFKDDPVLYFMIKKTSKLVSRDEKLNDKIFKLGEYVFYPLHMLDLKSLTLAYAITIHKSQGSDYGQIMVVLPKAKGHPLLNRQIVYTAITRTKGNTYLYTNKENLNHAKETVITRDTRLFVDQGIRII